MFNAFNTSTRIARSTQSRLLSSATCGLESLESRQFLSAGGVNTALDAHGAASPTLQAAAKKPHPVGRLGKLIAALHSIVPLTVTGAAQGLTSGVTGDLYSLALNYNTTAQSGSPAFWTIDWGDGAVDTVAGTATNATHVYSTPAIYSISATVTVSPLGSDAGPIHFTATQDTSIAKLMAGDVNGDGVVNFNDIEVMLSSNFEDGTGGHTRAEGDLNGDGFINNADMQILLQNNGAHMVAGDVNGDGVVDFTDVQIVMMAHYNDGTTGHVRAEGDLNGDGLINAADLTILFQNFGHTA